MPNRIDFLQFIFEFYFSCQALFPLKIHQRYNRFKYFSLYPCQLFLRKKPFIGYFFCQFSIRCTSTFFRTIFTGQRIFIRDIIIWIICTLRYTKGHNTTSKTCTGKLFLGNKPVGLSVFFHCTLIAHFFSVLLRPWCG